MNWRLLSTFIPMLSLIIFFVWGWLEGTYQHSWIIFMVGGMAMGIISNMNRQKNREKFEKSGEADGNDRTE